MVKGVAESIGWVVRDAPVVEVAAREDKEAGTEELPLQDETYFQAPEDISLEVPDEPGWDLLADEDDLWDGPSTARDRRFLGCARQSRWVFMARPGHKRTGASPGESPGISAAESAST